MIVTLVAVATMFVPPESEAISYVLVLLVVPTVVFLVIDHVRATLSWFQVPAAGPVGAEPLVLVLRIQ